MNKYTVLNKSFATLNISQIFGSLCFANHFKDFIKTNTNYLHKQNNIFRRILKIGCCFIRKTIHQGCITKSAQNMHTHKYDSNNTPYLSDHTLVFCLKIKARQNSNVCNLVADTLIINFLGNFFTDPTTLCAVITRAGSGISGSRVPDNSLGYPNPVLSSGTREIALWVDLISNRTYQ